MLNYLGVLFLIIFFNSSICYTDREAAIFTWCSEIVCMLAIAWGRQKNNFLRK